MGDLTTRLAAPGSDEQLEVIVLCELLRQATEHYVSSSGDPRHAMALLMTALPMYAGTIFGTLMVMGEVTQQDTARMAKMVQTNFLQGIKVGLSRASRAAKETGFMGAVQ